MALVKADLTFTRRLRSEETFILLGLLFISTNLVSNASNSAEKLVNLYMTAVELKIKIAANEKWLKANPKSSLDSYPPAARENMEAGYKGNIKALANNQAKLKAINASLAQANKNTRTDVDQHVSNSEKTAKWYLTQAKKKAHNLPDSVKNKINSKLTELETEVTNDLQQGTQTVDHYIHSGLFGGI